MSIQDESFKSHSHYMYHTHDMTHGHTASTSLLVAKYDGDTCVSSGPAGYGWWQSGWASTTVDSHNGSTGGSREYTNDTGGTETRPKNFTIRIYKRIS